MATHHHASLIESFGSASVEQLHQLLTHADVVGSYASKDQTACSSLEGVLPLGASSLLVAVLARPAVEKYDSTPMHENIKTRLINGSLLRGNVCSALKALRWRGSSATTDGGSLWTSEEAVAYGERMLQVPETAFKLVAPPGSSDYAALRFLAEAVRKNMSAAEVARALEKEVEGQKCLEAFHTSPTLGAVVGLASWWWDDVLDWLEGAVQWVKDAASAFGEWATKQSKALVDNVFSRYEGVVHVLEEVPFLGLGVAAIYAVAGDGDHAWAALAINLNAIVTVAAASLGFALGGPAGSMAGGAIGKAAGLGIQMALSHLIHDPKLRAEVGDISLTRFLIEVFLAGATYGGAVGVAKTLATELGFGFLKKLGLSLTLAALMSELPNFFT